MFGHLLPNLVARGGPYPRYPRYPPRGQPATLSRGAQIREKRCPPKVCVAATKREASLQL